jgi:hypothetical protein
MKVRLLFAVLAMTALISGCQSTSIRSAWFDTDFAGPPFRKVMVVGDIGTTAGARTFEDDFVARLRAAGVDAIASHTVKLDDPNVTEASFVAAVAGSGAQGLLLVRLLGVDTRTQVTTMMTQGGAAWGRGPWGGPTSRTMVTVPQVRQYELAAVETKLYDVKTRQLVWAATTSTFNPVSLARETPAFAELIIGQLAARGVIERK